MSNIENVDREVTIVGSTVRDSDDNSTYLAIPNQIAKELDIENSKVSMTLIYDYEGSKHLLLSKFHREIIID